MKNFLAVFMFVFCVMFATTLIVISSTTNKIDEKLNIIQNAVRENIPGDGLGYIDYSDLTQMEKAKFQKEFEGIGEDIFIKEYKGRDFIIEIYDYE